MMNSVRDHLLIKTELFSSQFLLFKSEKYPSVKFSNKNFKNSAI